MAPTYWIRHGRIVPQGRLAVVAAATALTLVACGGGTVTPSAPQAQVELAPPVAAAPAVDSATLPEPPGGQVLVETVAVDRDLPAATTGIARVGLLLPLTGRGGPVGQAMLDAAQLALFEAGLDHLELLPKDTLGTPGGAARAAEDALADGASLLLGPLFGGSVAAVAPIAQAANVPVIAFSNDRSVAGQGIYLLGVTPDEQVGRILGFAVDQGVFRIVALVPQNAYGNAVATALYGAAARTYADIVGVEYFAPGTPDLSATVEKMVVGRATGETAAERSFDAVLIAAGGAELNAIAPLFPYYDVDTNAVRLLGISQWQREETLREPALRGGWFSAPPTEHWEAFENRYRILFGAPPPEPAALVYDAVELAGLLVASAGASASRFDTPTIDETVLFDPAGFDGLRGAYSFDAQGIARHALAIYRVAAGRFEQIDAPRGATGPPIF